MIECKSCYGNTFNFGKLSQYESLVSYKDCYKTKPAVVLWFIDHGRVFYFPVQTIMKMKQDGCKSININKLDGYYYIEVPSRKKIINLDSDYYCIIDREEC